VDKFLNHNYILNNGHENNANVNDNIDYNKDKNTFEKDTKLKEKDINVDKIINKIRRKKYSKNPKDYWTETKVLELIEKKFI
jgi:hypothetical protein